MAGIWNRIVDAFAESVPPPTREELSGDAFEPPKPGAIGSGGAGVKRIVVDRERFEQMLFGGGRNPAAQLAVLRATRSVTNALGLVGSIREPEVFNLFDEIAEDPAVASVEEAIKDAFGDLSWDIVTDDPDGPGGEIAIWAKAALEKADGFRGARDALRGKGRAHGFSVAQVFWDYRDGTLLPVRFRHEHPSRFAFTRDWRLLISVAGELTEPPPGKFVVFRLDPVYGNPFGTSALMPLRFLWAVKKGAMKGEVETARAFGRPFLVFTLTEKTQDKQEARDELLGVIRELDTTDGVVLGRGEEVEVMSRSLGSGGTPSANLVAYCDKMVSRLLSGADLVQGMGDEGRGSMALGNVHDRKFQARVARIARLEEDSWNGLLEEMVRLNFGSVDPDIVRFEIDTADERDVDASKVALDTARDHGLSIPEPVAREWLGVRAPLEGESVLVAPGASGREGESAAASDDGSGDRGDDDEDPDEPARFSETDADAVEFAERGDLTTLRGEALSREVFARIEKIAAALTKENGDALRSAVAAALGRVSDSLGADATVGAVVETVAALSIPALDASVAEALASVRGLAMLDALETGAEWIRNVPTTVALDDLAPEYRAASEWMSRRKIASRAELKEMARAVSRLGSGIGADVLEQELRRDVIALARATNDGLATMFRDRLAESIGRGDTVKEFVASFDNVPGLAGMDGYLETVYRTETATAYSKERERAYNDPDLAPHVWGRRLHNGLLPSSRPSHIAINGLALRKGSEADRAAGQPPFSYNCTCTATMLIAADPATADYREPDDALTRVRGIERFS